MNSQTGLSARIHDYSSRSTQIDQGVLRSADAKEEHAELDRVEASAEAEVETEVMQGENFEVGAENKDAAKAAQTQRIENEVDVTISRMMDVNETNDALPRNEGAIKAHERLLRRWHTDDYE